MPLIIACAKSLGKTGYESKEELDGDRVFMNRLERLRQKSAVRMGLGDVKNSINPKITMIAPARYGGTITSRYFTPFDCHSAHAVSAGVCLGAACLTPGTLAQQMADILLPKNITEFEKEIVIEHVSGKISTVIVSRKIEKGLVFPKASFVRTARPLFEGYVCYLD